MGEPAYAAEVFSPRSVEEAKRIILTPEPGISTGERWEKETPYIADELVAALKPAAESTILDYGCGIGRLAKAVIERIGCAVIGVDISARMRAYAQVYVESDDFIAMPPGGLDRLISRGVTVDHAYAVWVLQHCLDPAREIRRIGQALVPGGLFCVINSVQRWLPTDQGWQDDGKDVLGLVRAEFEEMAEIPLHEGPLSATLRDSSFCRVFRKA
jgi:SAM-dependent methyltransferase